MKYKELRSLYYKSRELYQEEYLIRFNSPGTIKLNFSVKGNQAFFIFSDEVAYMLYQILQTDKVIGKLCSSLPGVAINQYKFKCLIDEVVVTNKIEGVHSSRKEIGEILHDLETQSKAKNRSQRFIGMVRRYNMLTKSDKEEIPIETIGDIRKLYDEIALPEVIFEEASHAPDGRVFRKNETFVIGETGKIIHEGTMPEERIIDEVEKALAFLRSDVAPALCRISIFHYLIEYTHPFYDGNGRLGRFIVSYYLSKELHPLMAYRFSEVVKENITQYYKAFQSCNDKKNKGDLTPFLIMMLEMMLVAGNELKESLERKNYDLITYENKVRALSTYSKRNMSEFYTTLIYAALYSETGISTQELIALYGSYAIVNRLIKNAETDKVLISKKEGHEKYYQIDLEALDSL